MSDERLRDLERRAREGGAEAQAAWLAERVRLGRLERRRLEVAAHCGHEGARLALGEPLAAEGDWGRQLGLLGGKPAVVAALVAVARGLLARTPPEPLSSEDEERLDRLVEVLVLAEGWLAAPGPRARRALLGAYDRTGSPINPWGGWWTSRLRLLLLRVVESIATDHDGERATLCAHALGTARELVERAELPEELVLPAARAAVVTWALADEPRSAE